MRGYCVDCVPNDPGNLDEGQRGDRGRDSRCYAGRRADRRSASQRSDGRFREVRVQQVAVPGLPAWEIRPAAEALPFIDATPSGTLFRAIQQRWQQSLDRCAASMSIRGYGNRSRDGHRATPCARLGRILREGAATSDPRSWAAGYEPSWVFISTGRQLTSGTRGGVSLLQSRCKG
jgi:hypothetical protein